MLARVQRVTITDIDTVVALKDYEETTTVGTILTFAEGSMAVVFAAVGRPYVTLEDHIEPLTAISTEVASGCGNATNLGTTFWVWRSPGAALTGEVTAGIELGYINGTRDTPVVMVALGIAEAAPAGLRLRPTDREAVHPHAARPYGLAAPLPHE